MNALRAVASAVAIVIVVGVGAGEEKKDQKDIKAKLVGAWVVVKADEGTVPPDTEVTFGKDGKFKVVAKRDGEEKAFDGTYTVAGDSFTFKIKVDDAERMQKIQVTRLTADALSTKDEKDRVVEFKRKK